ncbi:TolC family protein [Winogradskyella sp.]|jgi:outer membrane protein TolC|uniref:TolC family protein n=1 Tax=Winogradskyella sp. TaxID=1883156 RepID=UPI0025EE04D9|nr:TolC family protein [Winogradskyella sp.]MCT4630359.1 TolC family protein [Winogradskyella sp.]
MKNSLKTLALLLVALFVNTIVNAQDSIVSSKEPESFRLIIPKLEVLIDSAWANNGLLGYRKDQIEVKKSNLKSKRRNWTRNFGIAADSRYGTFNNVSTNDTGGNTVNLASTTTQLNYSVGFFLKIPVFDILHRKADVKQAQAEISQAENYVKFQKNEIKETVIKYYEDLLLKQNLLELKAKNFGNAKVSMEMAEKEYKNGLIPIYEYVRLFDITARIEAEYEQAKSAFMLSKQLLENLTGITIK